MKKQIWMALIASSLVVPALLNRAVAQVAVPALTISHSTGPVLANPGEHILFCMSGRHATFPIIATLRLEDAITGVVVEQKQITLSPSGGTALPSDPCLEYVVPVSITSTDAAVFTSVTPVLPPLYLGLVSLNPKPLPPGGLAASIQVFTPGVGGTPVNIRYIPALPPDPCAV